MNLEQSCGAVVYRDNDGKIEYLIIQSINGHYSFPKGHSEGNETEVETALREIKEETGLDVNLDENFREVVSYLPSERTIKNVVFFIAESLGQEVHKQDAEIKSAAWMSYEEAMEIISFPNDKKIITHAREFLKLKKG